MNTATWKTRVSALLVTGLLALAGVFSNSLPALAQAPCPLPDGVTAPDDPRVTAQQVTDGSASLMGFALAVRERSVEHSQQATAVEEGLYIGCIIRQDNGTWRSGDTYIVTLTPDGRVNIHAKDMSLSGRMLNPLIYAEILSALGVPQPIWPTRALPILLWPASLSKPSWPGFLKNRMLRSMPPSRHRGCGRAYPVLPVTPPSITQPNCNFRSC